MRFTINLATRTYISARRVNASFAVIAAILLLVLFPAVLMIVSGEGEKQRLNRDIAALDKKFGEAGTGVSEKQYKELLKSVAAANEIIYRKSLNWLGLFDIMEATVPEGVSIIGLTPSLKDNSLAIAGEAKTFRHLRNFLENLENSPYFHQVYLLSQDIPGDKGLSFSISCNLDLKAL